MKMVKKLHLLNGVKVKLKVLDVIKKKTVRYEYERKLVFNYLYMVV